MVAEGTILTPAGLSTFVAVLATVTWLVAVNSLPAWLARAGSAHGVTSCTVLARAVSVAGFAPFAIRTREVAGWAPPAWLAFTRFRTGAGPVNARVVTEWQTSRAICRLNEAFATHLDSPCAFFNFCLVRNHVSNPVFGATRWECQTPRVGTNLVRFVV